jgi:hypothetical protein
MKPKIKEIKLNLLGVDLPTDHATRGKALEDYLANHDMPVSQGPGADYPDFDLEVKTKDTESTSANCVGSMSIENIIKTPYELSCISAKLKSQLRVKVTTGIVVKSDVYDFSPAFIQELLKEAYETARSKIVNGDRNSFVYGTSYGYFERKKKHGVPTNSYMFRITVGAMDKLENMAKSTYNSIFE